MDNHVRRSWYPLRYVKDVGRFDCSSYVEGSDIRLLLSTEDTDSSTVQSRVGRRTLPVVGTNRGNVLVREGTCVGVAGGVLEGRQRVKNILASVVAEMS